VPELEKKASATQAAAPAKEKEQDNRPPFSYFSEAAASKDIFKPIIKEETSSQPSAEAEQAKKAEEIKSQLNLLGVVWGEKPQAIIEDKKAQKTYFLNKGESLDSVEVKDIFENKVILSYNGQQFELVM
jgi:type II secretory pathway component PulC